MPELSSNNKINHSSSSNDSEAKGMGWLLPLLLLVFAAALALYFIKSTSTTSLPIAQQFVQAEDTSINKTAILKIDSSRRSLITIKLPNNSVITGSQDGIEIHLVEYLNNRKDTINKNRWFNFDDLSFENDDTTLTSASMHQIENIVFILKAYPKMKIKIGAFSDKTNNEVTDLTLTQQKADAVEAALKKTGANAAQIISAEGYGSKYAKAATNAPLDEKMKDKKISINVTEK